MSSDTYSGALAPPHVPSFRKLYYPVLANRGSHLITQDSVLRQIDLLLSRWGKLVIEAGARNVGQPVLGIQLVSQPAARGHRRFEIYVVAILFIQGRKRKDSHSRAGGTRAL